MAKELDSSKFWLIKNNPITKAGIFPYLGRQISPDLEPERIYHVLRPEAELFAEETVKSFNLIPLLIGHPRTLLGRREEGFVPAEEKGMDGTTGEAAKREGDKIVNDIKLFSERIKDEVNSGKKELSAGYFCDFVPEAGLWRGQHYDFVQKNIRGNHIALVEKGRSGSDVRVMDSAEALPKNNRQFVCDAMDIEGKIEQHEGDMKKNANDANWDEGKHKRDSDGKFSSGGGGGIKKSEDPKKSASQKLVSIIYKKDADGEAIGIQQVGSGKFVATTRSSSKTFNTLNGAKSWMASKGYSLPKTSTDENLSSETNGDGGKHAAPNKENEMDKREIIREIMAISAKPVTEFEGGEEEKVEAIAKLAEKLAYNPSEAGANDAGPGSNPKDEPKDNASDEDDPKDEPKDEPKEDKKAASLDEMEKELLARMGRKTELVKRLTPIIGAFDSAAMTEKEVAAYACEKLGKKVAMDNASEYLKGYLDAYRPSQTRITFRAAQDSAPAGEDKVLAEFKEGK